MVIQKKHESGVVVLTVDSKRVDALSAPDLRSRIEQVVAEGESKLLLDLSQVEFMDSSGLGALVASLKSMGGQGQLCIGGARGVVEQLFKLTHMDRIFSLHSDLDEALAKMA